MPGFQALGIDPRFSKLLTQRGITVPTPIQHQAIPIGLEGKDVIGIAQTGTGKTFAFGLPMLQKLAQSQGRALIVVPTRELAHQIEEALRPFASLLAIRMAVFVGGASMYLQRQALKTNPRILIATPGRLNDHLEQRTVTLKEVQVLVLDEADRMLDMGFKPQIDRILRHVPRTRQTMLFSATMPQDIIRLATAEMHLPLRIEVAPSGTTVATIEQELIIVEQQGKIVLLQHLLKEHLGSVLVFSRTKHGAKKITKSLNVAGFRAAEIHSNKSLAQRLAALAGFKAGKYRILVATDIASRGIDVTNIEVVINYDLPDDAADYVHRIGRTARAGREGRAISFATPNQARDIRDIERLIRTSLKRRVHASMPSLSLDTHMTKDQPRHRQFGGFRSRRPNHRGRGRTFRGRSRGA
ncbi:DEAD/DEAH box helicase [Candidatus Peregrinibacteria bacterium]|nr:DEAD/DEAH box helicase [Candidatus Peregrinibacteria bacterium]